MTPSGTTLYFCIRCALYSKVKRSKKLREPCSGAPTNQTRQRRLAARRHPTTHDPLGRIKALASVPAACQRVVDDVLFEEPAGEELFEEEIMGNSGGEEPEDLDGLIWGL